MTCSVLFDLLDYSYFYLLAEYRIWSSQLQLVIVFIKSFNEIEASKQYKYSTIKTYLKSIWVQRTQIDFCVKNKKKELALPSRRIDLYKTGKELTLLSRLSRQVSGNTHNLPRSNLQPSLTS